MGMNRQGNSSGEVEEAGSENGGGGCGVRGEATNAWPPFPGGAGV